MSQNPSTIRVLTVDDSPATRAALSIFIEAHTDLELAGHAANGYEAIAACASLDPDVVLVDLNIVASDGVAATREICDGCPNASVIALTSSVQEYATALRQAGAFDVLEKGCSSEELATAIRAARQITL
jgi:NarL family two-component system response regulator LiaR